MFVQDDSSLISTSEENTRNIKKNNNSIDGVVVENSLHSLAQTILLHLLLWGKIALLGIRLRNATKHLGGTSPLGTNELVYAK